MDRYEAIEAAADLGGIEMFPDRTPDRRKEETPGAVGAATGGKLSNPITTKELN